MSKHDDLIFDVGMHKGEDTDFYLKKGFRVVAFEADPGLAEHCRHRFASAIDDGKLTIVEGAVVPTEHRNGTRHTVSFYRNLDQSVWGTADAGWADRNQTRGTRTEVIDVRRVDFAESLRRYGVPHYMKIDIEGLDAVCLETLFRFDPRPDYVSIESGEIALGRVKDEIALMERLGYTSFKAVQQATVSEQVQPTPPAEGRFAVGHHFLAGASGLFGRELPGAWQPSRRLLRRYGLIAVLEQLFGKQSLLWRFRLTRAALWRTGKLIGMPHLVGWYDTHAKHSSVAE